MVVDIIGSSSKGNCAIIDDVLVIDCGVNNVERGTHVLITHHHTDHTKHIPNFAGCWFGSVESVISKLHAKNPYLQVHILITGSLNRVADRYVVKPLELIHDAPCVGYDIANCVDSTRILFCTDFNRFADEAYIIKNLKDKVYDAIYIECNNTLDPTSLMDVWFCYGDEPKDEFHRRKSLKNHCSATYLASLFGRAGYNENNRFTEPVTLLHKSSYYYQNNQTELVKLCKIANIINPLYE